MVTQVYLTQKEKKRLSSNYQKIMGSDAVIDPSGTELIAKAII